MSKPDESTLRTAANAILEAMSGRPIEPTDGWVFAAKTLAVEWLREHPEAAEGFDEFWQAYPRREAKVAAVRAWQKLKPSPELRKRIIGDIAARWVGAEFIPHPATYLNGRRWEDEPTPAGKKTANGYHRPNAAADIWTRPPLPCTRPGREEVHLANVNKKIKNAPTEAGFYWALWISYAAGTHEGEQLTPANEWEIVEVWENFTGYTCDADEDEKFGVSVTGVRESQWLQNFLWGEGPIERK